MRLKSPYQGGSQSDDGWLWVIRSGFCLLKNNCPNLDMQEALIPVEENTTVTKMGCCSYDSNTAPDIHVWVSHHGASYQQGSRMAISLTFMKAEAPGMKSTTGNGLVSSSQPRRAFCYHTVLLTTKGCSCCTLLR